MAAPSKSKLSLNHRDIKISPKLQAQIDSCPKDVRSYIEGLVSKITELAIEIHNYSVENGRLNAEKVSLQARLKLCEAGVIEERKSKEKLAKMPSDELQRILLERINFDSRLHQEISAAKRKKN